MKRRQFNDILLKVAKESKSKLVIIGSQAFFAATKSDDIPEIVSISDEVDLLPGNSSEVDSIEQKFGEESEYFYKYGKYVHALDNIDRHILTEGWKERLVPYKIKDKAKGKEYEVLCLSLLDVCVNKLCWGREKDYRFISDVISDGHIRMEEIESLSGSVKENFKKMVIKNIEKAKEFIQQSEENNSITR
jgi:hypothetical protein